MIERYTRDRMGAIWSEENKFRTWLQVEIAACEAWAAEGAVPPEAVEAIEKKARFSVERIAEIEAEVDHDLIAFLSCVAENVGDEARYIHKGLTSYDVEDTALALRLRESADLLLEGLDDLRSAIAEKADEHRYTVMMGRTHGVHAEPITFGLKMACWLGEVERGIERLRAAREVVSVGKISGAVGTYAHCPPQIEERVCRKLGLRPAKASTQIVQRDRHAQFISTLAILAGSLERFATEVRNLQRTELLEVQERFTGKQKGSSAMPHKRNPWHSERISGLARLVRGYALAAMENEAQWHERDLSNSAPERVIFPDACIVLDFMIAEMCRVVRGLQVDAGRMRRNIDLMRGLVFSQRVLLALAEKGLSRDEAYRIVQRNAARVWEDPSADFRQVLLSDRDVSRRLSPEELDSCFDLSVHTAHVDTILARFGL